MPSLSTTVEVTTTKEIKLSPKLRKKILVAMKTYGSLKQQRDALDHAMKGHRTEVEAALSELGEESIVLDGHKATFVAPVRKKLDEKLLIKAGVKRETIDACTTETSTTPYIKITLPGQKEEA